MRFLVDENLPEEVAQILESLGHEALAIVGSPLRGISDEEIWALAAKEERIIVTQDLDFPLQRVPGPLGSILLRLPQRFNVDELIPFARDFFEGWPPEAFVGRITVISMGGIRHGAFSLA